MITGVGGPVAAEESAKCRTAGAGAGWIISSDIGGLMCREAQVLDSRKEGALGNLQGSFWSESVLEHMYTGLDHLAAGMREHWAIVKKRKISVWPGELVTQIM